MNECDGGDVMSSRSPNGRVLLSDVKMEDPWPRPRAQWLEPLAHGLKGLIEGTCLSGRLHPRPVGARWELEIPGGGGHFVKHTLV